MIEEIKVEKMDAFKNALVAMKNKIDENALPAITESDDGKVLTASYSEETGNASWENLPDVKEVPEVSSGDNGKVLTASYSGDAGSYSWGVLPSPASLKYNTSTPQKIGEYEIVDAGTQAVTTKDIKTMVIPINSTIYISNGHLNIEISAIPNNAIVLDVSMMASYDGDFTLVKSTFVNHNPNSVPVNAYWDFYYASYANASQLYVGNMFITYIDMN